MDQLRSNRRNLVLNSNILLPEILKILDDYLSLDVDEASKILSERSDDVISLCYSSKTKPIFRFGTSGILVKKITIPDLAAMFYTEISITYRAATRTVCLSTSKNLDPISYIGEHQYLELDFPITLQNITSLVEQLYVTDDDSLVLISAILVSLVNFYNRRLPKNRRINL